MPNTEPLTSAQLERLRRIDSPTIANAIERFGVRLRVSGFMGMDIRCLFPELGVMVGYAVTATTDSQTEEAVGEHRRWIETLRAVEASPKPAVLVFQDVGPRRSHSLHFGDGMATVAKRLGAIGLVTDGGVRDLAGVRTVGFHYFAPGTTVSHRNQRLIDVNVPVTVSGVTIEPGDLIHADENGVVFIPAEIAARVEDEAIKVWEEEAEYLAYYRSAQFSLDEMAARELGTEEL